MRYASRECVSSIRVYHSPGTSAVGSTIASGVSTLASVSVTRARTASGSFFCLESVIAASRATNRKTSRDCFASVTSSCRPASPSSSVSPSVCALAKSNLSSSAMARSITAPGITAETLPNTSPSTRSTVRWLASKNLALDVWPTSCVNARSMTFARMECSTGSPSPYPAMTAQIHFPYTKFTTNTFFSSSSPHASFPCTLACEASEKKSTHSAFLASCCPRHITSAFTSIARQCGAYFCRVSTTRSYSPGAVSVTRRATLSSSGSHLVRALNNRSTSSLKRRLNAFTRKSEGVANSEELSTGE
mmetsp:Transcript_5145/g.14446  ORF Transcript_5145/g.14446 Transcript_5145/m.14446 type:complete len:304 (+) Transcript_5145:5500-6411(+)